MSSFVTKIISDKKLWESFLLSKKPGTFLQSWNWGEVNKKIGYKVTRFGFFKNGNLLGCALLIHQPAKRGSHYLIPGGPIVDYKNKRLVKYVFKEIREFAAKEKVWFVRIRPDIKEDIKIRNYFRSLNLNPAPMHVHGENTLVLDIQKDDDELLALMRKTTRYLIRKSLSEGYRVEISKNVEGISRLYAMQKETVKRHGFVGFKKKLFEEELRIFGSDGQALLFECKKKDKVLASAIVILYAEKAFYHFSASSQESLKTNASYFLQWQIIKKAKQLGMKYYDFWGIASKENPKHRFWGVTLFKRGFGGERIDWLHAHDIPVRSYYWITYFFETLRRGIRHL